MLPRRVDVRVLAWAGAPLPLFHPDRREVRDDARRADARHAHPDRSSTRTSGRCTATTRSSCSSTIAIAYVGGIDLTSFGGDRLDSTAHRAPARRRLARRVPPPGRAGRRRRREHFRLRWRGSLPAPQELRRGRAPRARGVSSCGRCPSSVYDGSAARRVHDPRELPARPARGRAPRLSREPVPLVAGADRGSRRQAPQSAARPTSASSSLLPAKPNNGSDDTRGQLGVLVDAAKDGGSDERFLACTLFQPGRRTPCTCTRRSASSTTRG